MDWVLPTDEILAKVERMVAEERRNTPVQLAAPIVHGSTAPEQEKPDAGFASRWRKLRLHVKQSA
jgi:hypothetical protein